MGIDAIAELVAIVLALSLATERLVLAIRTPHRLLWVVPWGKWLNGENKAEPEKDGPRRLVLQAITLMCALATGGFLAAGDWSLTETVKIGGSNVPLWLLAILATGGSSFWKNILGYTKAARDRKKDPVPI